MGIKWAVGGGEKRNFWVYYTLCMCVWFSWVWVDSAMMNYATCQITHIWRLFFLFYRYSTVVDSVLWFFSMIIVSSGTVEIWSIFTYPIVTHIMWHWLNHTRNVSTKCYKTMVASGLTWWCLRQKVSNAKASVHSFLYPSLILPSSLS